MTTSISRQHIFLKSLIDHYHQGSSQELLKNWDLPEHFEKLNRLGTIPGDPKDLLVDPRKILESIHYSWIDEAMESLPKYLYPSLLASLNEHQRQNLCRLHDIDVNQLKDVAEPVQLFLLEKLYRKLEGVDETLPLSFSPDYPLSKLLKIDKNLLLEMFDLLGLHDLAAKAKQIVDKTTLNSIDKSLTPIRKKIYKAFLQKVDKAQLPEIDLSNWTGEPRILKKILHRRGILRLSSALAGYSKDFMWYFTRKLDTGRGRIVLRCYTEEATPIVPILTEQVQFIMNILTQKSES